MSKSGDDGPLRCDQCGRFVSFADIDAGLARHKLVQPDSWYGSEAYETLCQKCKE